MGRGASCMTSVRRSTGGQGVMHDTPPPTTTIPLKDREPKRFAFDKSQPGAFDNPARKVVQYKYPPHRGMVQGVSGVRGERMTTETRQTELQSTNSQAQEQQEQAQFAIEG